MFLKTWRWIILSIHGIASLLTLIFIIVVIVTPGTFPVLLIIALFLEIVAFGLEFINLREMARITRLPKKWGWWKLRVVKRWMRGKFCRSKIGKDICAKLRKLKTLLKRSP